MKTYENFFIESAVIFKPCRKPEKDPDYVSRNRWGIISSMYFYGEDEGGAYVIRCSDHWGFGIRSCSWYLKTKNEKILKEKRYKKNDLWKSLP